MKTKFHLDWSLVLRLIKHVYIVGSGSKKTCFKIVIRI